MIDEYSKKEKEELLDRVDNTMQSLVDLRDDISLYSTKDIEDELTSIINDMENIIVDFE